MILTCNSFSAKFSASIHNCQVGLSAVEVSLSDLDCVPMVFKALRFFILEPCAGLKQTAQDKVFEFCMSFL